MVYNVTNFRSDTKLGGGKCNLYQGIWVVDNSYPLYKPLSCPFINPQFDCIKYGRPDKQYLKYSWKPDSCNLPRFDGMDFLRRWRRKKIMFVGDSLSLNRWISLYCMVHASVPNSKTTYVRWDYVQDGTTILEDMNRLTAFNKGLNTWARWVELNIDPSKTEVFFQGISPTHYLFFQGISPTHYLGKEWNSTAKNCYGEHQPITGSTYPAGEPAAALILKKVLSSMKKPVYLLEGEPAAALILKKVLSSMKKPVYLLDITMLSQLRIDGHPSACSGDHPGIDCARWCLTAVPDTWNHLLCAALITSSSTPPSSASSPS